MADSGMPPPPPSGPPPETGVPDESDYPVVVDFDRGDEVARWRPLVNWLLAIPQFVVVYLLAIVERALALLSFFLVLFTTRIPDGIFNFRVMTYRYQWRVTTFALFMRDEYPPFSFATTPGDDGIDTARLSIQPPGEMNRWLPLVKWILAIPHYIVLTVLGVGVFFVWIFTFFAVIITGRYPQTLRDYVVGVARWGYRVNAYVLFMTDQYPPFRLS
jgi:hypothetical protein